MDPFIAPEKTHHGARTEPASRDRIPQGTVSQEPDGRKLRTQRERQGYALRMETVAPVLGQIKQGRGVRQFLQRGLAKVREKRPLTPSC